jgi:CheY-like chemotaxis protein
MTETLLLADANPTMQRVVELTCAEEGIKVVSVSDGQQALEYLTATRPAVALISLTLQKLDGFEIAGLVRDRPDLQGIPVLLLAGAFETIDEARVRASGASGVLVKPFEPGLVIKRVKELLGMSKLDGPPTVEEFAQSQSGRLFTSGIVPADRVGEDGAAAAPAGDGAQPDGVGAWRELREASGLGPDAVAVETLDAAFESLDAQQASRSAPAGRATAPPEVPRIPDALDPERRPTPPPVREPSLHDQVAAPPEAPRAADAIHEDWFAKHAASGFAPEEFADGGEAHHDTVEGSGRQSAESAPNVVGAIDWRAFHEEVPTASVEQASSADESSKGQVHATYGDPSPPAVGFPAADAFAMLWAHEQGEPLPPVPPLPPVELSERTVEAVATRTTDQLTDRVTNDLATRVTEGLATRVTEGLAGRITDDLAWRISNDLTPHFGDSFVERVTTGIAGRLTDAVADRVGNRLSHELGAQVTERLGERLTEELAARVSAGLAEQIAAHVAERMMQQAIGESLRQTVHEVSERLVREEIARIRAAAKE